MFLGRAFWFSFAAFSFYLFGNQTQIGWLYVVSALLLGVVGGAWWLNRGALQRLSIERQLDLRDAYYEDEQLCLSFRLNNQRRLPAPQIMLHDPCPVLAPSAPERDLRLLFPFVPVGISTHQLEFKLYQRGVYAWQPLELRSGAPFGFFSRRRLFSAPQRLMVYPVVRPLAQFALLDQQAAAQWTTARAGWGSEVLGVRDYQHGDALRHIHWRSVARRGQLVTKEFSDEAHPALTLVLDRYQPSNLPAIRHKHTPFEWQIRCAVSIAEYAFRRRYPSYLVSAEAEGKDKLVLPHGALSWEALLQLSAQLQPTPQDTLADVMAHASLQGVVVVLSAYLSTQSAEALISVRRRGFRVLLVHCPPASFPDVPAAFGTDAERALSAVIGAGIPIQPIPYACDWAERLSEG